MDEIKAMLESLVQGCLKARNTEDEKTDKRKLIDEVAGIMKSAGADDELIRTAIAKMEKLAYDKSEADTADNKKAKNEDEEELKEQIRTREVREDDEEEKEEEKEVEDKEAKNEEDKKGECLYKEFKEKVEKEAENKCKKAKNSLDEFKKEFFNGKAEKTTGYMSQDAGIELGKKLY